MYLGRNRPKILLYKNGNKKKAAGFGWEWQFGSVSVMLHFEAPLKKGSPPFTKMKMSKKSWNQQLNARFYSCTCFRGGSCPSSTCGRKRCVVLNSDNGGLWGRVIEAARQLISLSLKAETLGCPIASPINIHLCQHTSLISFCHFFSLSVWVFTVKM